MRVLITAVGSRGDVQPMLALALGLRARGHDVSLAAAPDFRQWIESSGVTFIEQGRNVEAGLRRKGSMKKGFISGLVEDTRAQFHFIDRAPDVDLVVGGGAAFAARTHAEARGVPGAFVVFSPPVIPSAKQEPATPIRMPAWTWPFFGWLWRVIFNFGFLRAFNAERRRRALPEIRDVFDHVLGADPLLAADPQLGRLPADAPPRALQCGQFVLPEAEELDPALLHFLNAGPAPVYIGFGSMPDARPEKTTALLLHALEASGLRAVLASGWADLGLGRPLPAGVFCVRSAPHSKLLPRCAAAVHHGGAGTTHAAARAGIPQIIVPHLGDQFTWARALRDLGVAEIIPRERLSSRRLEQALRRCVTDTGMRERARDIASHMRSDGVDQAILHLETLVNERRRSIAAHVG